MIVGLDQVGPVQATETHLHPIGQHRFAHRQRAAANGAEPPLGVGRGAIVRRRSGPRERARREVDEGHEGCAGGAAAHATVAVHDAHRIGACPIAHSAAQTSSGPVHSVASLVRPIATSPLQGLRAGVIRWHEHGRCWRSRRAPAGQHVGAKRAPAARHAIPEPVHIAGERADHRDQTDHDRRDAEPQRALAVEVRQGFALRQRC